MNCSTFWRAPGVTGPSAEASLASMEKAPTKKTICERL